MSVRSYSFHEERLSDRHIFKLPETAVMETLVSGSFKELVESAGLQGLKFRKVA